jgi:translation elongation factor EF-G
MSLSSLKVDGTDIEGFDASRSDYSMLVPFNKEKVTIDAVPISTMTDVEGSGEIPLHEGENIVNIKVVAKDGSSHGYTLNITREKNELPSPTIVPQNIQPDNDAELEELSKPLKDEQATTGITVTIVIISLMLIAMIGGIISLLVKRYNHT